MVIPVMIGMSPKITRIPDKQELHVFNPHPAALAPLHQAGQLLDFGQEPVALRLVVDVDVHRHAAVAAIEVGPDGGAGGFGEAAGSGVVGSHFCLCVVFVLC
jgi:hypothetical protein